jgi:hypothetical protein
MKKDFFISYNQADRAVAVWIAQQLEGAGYSTIIQAEDMPPGSNFVLEMHQAATAAARTIAVLSPSFLQSQFTQPEWAAAFAKDPTSANRTLLPVRVRECQPIGLLAQIVYIDLVGKAGDEARQLLLDGLNRERERLSLPVRFPVDELLERYCQHLAARVSTVRIFGDEAPHPLDQVFVELSLNEEYERRPNQAEFLGLMDSELRRMRSVFGDVDERRELDADDPAQRHLAKTKRTLKPNELLRRHTHAVITGAPGCGKTTLLRYLAWQTLKQWQTAAAEYSTGSGSDRVGPSEQALPRLPVFLELKQLTAAAFQATQGQLEDLLFNAAIAARLKPNAAERAALQQHFNELLRAGQVAVFLDGLDEVSGASFSPDLQKMVSDFLQSVYSQNTVIISTRPYALRQFGHAKMLEILPLSPRQIEQFIAHYYRDVPERQQFQRELQRRRELRELARVPALLGFILQLWRKRGSVTDDKLELYEQITHELAQQLDREKEGIAPDRQWLIEDTDGSLKLDLLRQLAFNQLFRGLIRPPYDIGSTDNDATRLVFTGEQLRDEAESFAASLYQRLGRSIDPYALAADVKATALLRQVGADHYAFAHLTLQEYLAAWQLAKRDNGDTCERIFCRAYFNPTLAEMEALPMTLGLIDRPDEFYEVLEQLPESLNCKRLRVQARGLAYALGINSCWIQMITQEILLQLTSQGDYARTKTDMLSLSLSTARSTHKNAIVDSVARAITGETTLSYLNFLQVIGGHRAAEVLFSLASDKSTDGFSSAIYGLGRINEPTAERRLLEMLKNADANTRSVVLDALGIYANETAKDGLIEALRDEYSDNRWRAAEGLSKIRGEGITAALIALLKDEDWYVRRRVAAILGRRKDRIATLALHQALNDEDDRVAREVAESLALMGDERIVDELTHSGRRI